MIILIIININDTILINIVRMMILICTVTMIEFQGYIGIARYPIRYRTDTDISVTNVISANTDIAVSVVVYR